LYGGDVRFLRVRVSSWVEGHGRWSFVDILGDLTRTAGGITYVVLNGDGTVAVFILNITGSDLVSGKDSALSIRIT
jgi:hypothetical protein